MHTIHRANEVDWPAIWALFRSVAARGDVFAYDEDTSEEVARQLWFDPPSTCYVAEENGLVLGTYFVRPNQPGRGSHVANGGYMVAPEARGKGLATSLCEHSLNVARQLGFTAMQYNFVIATNSAAMRVWEKCGFTIVGRSTGAFRHKELGLVDVLVMFRKL